MVEYYLQQSDIEPVQFARLKGMTGFSEIQMPSIQCFLDTRLREKFRLHFWGKNEAPLSMVPGNTRIESIDWETGTVECTIYDWHKYIKSTGEIVRKVKGSR